MSEDARGSRAGQANAAMPSARGTGSPRAGGQLPPGASEREASEQGLARLLNPGFLNLLARLSDRAYTRAEFDELPLPCGWGRDETWQALTAIRRAQGIHYPRFTASGGAYVDEWFTPTRSIEALQASIEAETAAGSWLDKEARRHRGLLSSWGLANEARLCAELDGLPGVSAQLQEAGLSAMERAERASMEALSREGILSLHEELAAEVRANCFPKHTASPEERGLASFRTPSTAALPQVDAAWAIDRPNPTAVLDSIDALVSGKSVGPFERPIITSQRLMHTFWNGLPLSSLNHTVGSIICRAYLIASGYPALACVPFTVICREWAGGTRTVRSSAAPWRPYRSAGNIEPGSWDWTPWWETCLALIDDEVAALEERTRETARQDGELFSIIDSDAMLNPRQQEALKEALLSPAAHMPVSAYRDKFGIAYSTARNDLEALVRLGLFSMRYEGKRQVFEPSRDLRETLLARRTGH